MKNEALSNGADVAPTSSTSSSLGSGVASVWSALVKAASGAYGAVCLESGFPIPLAPAKLAYSRPRMLLHPAWSNDKSSVFYSVIRLERSCAREERRGKRGRRGWLAGERGGRGCNGSEGEIDIKVRGLRGEEGRKPTGRE